MNFGVVAFAFGTPSTILSNELIARIAATKAMEQTWCPMVYTQQDIVLPPGITVTYTPEVEGNPPPTLRIARGAVEWALELGIKALYIAAAEPHLWRCIRDLKLAVKEKKADIQVHVCDGIKKYAKNCWYCAHSTQPRTASEKAWLKRERILGVMPFFVYKRVAS